MPSTALVISNLNRSRTLLLRQRSRKSKTATLNEHIFVLVAILGDFSDGSDTYILSANECQQRSNKEHFNTNKKPNEITVCLRTPFLLGHVLLGSTFFDPKNESALARKKPLS